MNNKPEFRFNSFKDDWRKIKLENVFEQTTNYVNPQLQNIELWSLTVEKGLTPKTERYNRSFLVKKEDQFKAASNGEFIYNPMNMTLGAVDLNNTGNQVAVSGYYVTMKTVGDFDKDYFNVWLKTPLAINLYKSYATGSLIEKQRVQFPTFSLISTVVPGIDEQKKIGSFFKNLDDVISLHQQELEALKQTKQGFLKKMFPKEGETVPKLRFKDCDGSWVRNKFENVLKSHAFKPYMANAEENGTYPVIQQGDNPIQRLSNGTPFENYMDVILFGDHTVSIYKPRTPFLVATDGIKILSADGIERNLLIPLLERYRPKSQGYKRHYTILKNEFVSYPTEIEEQRKIGDFFSQLDEVIELKEQELEALKQTKKGFLQKMFV